ncbi:phosphoribosylformylglycinamidine cyclo-ligase [Candidatus Desantisbacteria bacterium]|nr:phosphoribosylformylglycinamidine cyclo-ligase [Candidatus Desantisbacteria bacterium]
MGVTYKDAGVDINEASLFIKNISKMVQSTFTKGVMSGIGGFSGLFKLNINKYVDPILVSCTDGVGTKLKIAFAMDQHDTIGIDLVAMNVNDLIVCGASPLFFLDYIATGKLTTEKGEKIIEGIVSGCKNANCALIGGETAEMPGLYLEGEYDLAGFAVGVVEKKKIIDGRKVTLKDVVIGLPSSGLHSNGYSLVRKIFFEKAKYALTEKLSECGCSLGEELLRPTRIYVRIINKLIEKFSIKAIAHITGGGLLENIPRVLPSNKKVVIEKDKIPVLPIFEILQSLGESSEQEMFRTFNMGIGMVLIVDPDEADAIIKFLKLQNEKAYIIGEVLKGKGVEII